MELIKDILFIICAGLLAMAVFYTAELENCEKKGKPIPKIVSFNWPRLWFGFTICAFIFILFC